MLSLKSTRKYFCEVLSLCVRAWVVRVGVGGMRVLGRVCGNQETAFELVFFLPLWVLGIKVRSWGLSAKNFYSLDHLAGPGIAIV